MADFNTTVSLMIFEGGSLIQSLSASSQGQQLADKIENGAQSAIGSQQPHFDMAFSPIEIGMALAAITANQSALGQTLGQKISHALGAKLQELGISLDDSEQPGSVDNGGSQPVGGDEPTPPTDPANDGETVGDGEQAPEDANAEQ